MSLITDLRAVSGNAVEQLAARFADLPRPVLAAIGAGDMAVERLAELRESLGESLPARPGNPLHGTDVRAAMADLPTRAQKVASDVAAGMEQFAGEAPGRAQDLLAQLPDKLAELQTAAQFLSPDAVKETVGAYSQLAGMIYGSLAERGDKAWSKVRATGFRPGDVADAAVAEAAVAKVRPAGPATPRVPGATGAQDVSADRADAADSADSADEAVRTVDAPVVPSVPVVPTGHTAPIEAANVAEPDAGAASAPARKPRAPRVTAPISVPRPAVARAVGPRPAGRKPAAPRKPAG